MKKTWIFIIVIILVIIALVLVNKKPKVETPAEIGNTNTTAPTTSTKTTTSTTTKTTSTSTTTVKEVPFTIYGGNYYFDPNIIKVKQGSRVTIIFHNKEGFHNLRIDAYNIGTSVIPAYGEGKFTFIADKKGSFEFYCTVNNHRALGMKGTLVVE